MISVIIFLSAIIFVQGDLPCNARYEKYGSVVCVCNSTYCDEISRVDKLPPGSFVVYSSSDKGLRFKKNVGFVNSVQQKQENADKSPWYLNLFDFLNVDYEQEDVKLTFDTSKTYQTIEGFGGAFTDAAAINYNKLSKETREKLIMSYFSENGIEYNMGRVPIGGCDFSERLYAYNEFPEDDANLKYFNLSMEDYNYKIPFIKNAMDVGTSDIHLIGTAWSAPPWMKSNKQMTGVGRLLPRYYQTWANYHMKFLESYDRFGIPFWALSTGNEPMNGILPVAGYNCMGWWPQEQAIWIADNLGPTLRKSKFSDVKILALDDQRYNIPLWIELMEAYQKCMHYVDGIAIHWYSNSIIHPIFADITEFVRPDKFIISTEACQGFRDPNGEFVKLGSWERAEEYIKDIMEDLNHWYVGWIDWNLLLNNTGGPNWFGNIADATILTYLDKDEFVKQPTYYAVGHFSKFIQRGSKRIYVEQSVGSAIENVAFLRPDGSVAVVFYNRLSYPQKVKLGEKDHQHITIDVPGRSIHTVLFW